MTIESIAFNTHLAVELLSNEDPRTIARLICVTADEVKTLFRRLEVLDVIFIGGRRFVRCRSDILTPYPMLDLIFDRGRSVIAPGPKGYLVRFLNGRSGPVSNVTMHSTPIPGHRITYRGPKVRLWAEQFR
jgi:hypothetical protein